jgi:signal peptidase II
MSLSTFAQSQSALKYVVLVACFASWLVADLWTKHWADTRLADARHPLLLEIAAPDEGRTIRDVVSEQLTTSNAQTDERMLANIIRLPVAAKLDPQTRVFQKDNDLGRSRGAYVFWREDPKLAPRRFDKNEQILLTRWLRWGHPDAAQALISEGVSARLSDLELGPWLSSRIRRITEDEHRWISTDRIHPIHGPLQPVSAEDLAHAGDAFLIEWRQIDVMGDWFKFLYAENPGAAFGFMRSVPAATRDTVFFSLTFVVFLAILGIIIRTPIRFWVVLVALTGVLAGAAGNFVDRVRYGYVIDFIDMDLGFMHWPTYNVADIAITVGVILLLLDITFNPESPLVQDDGKDDLRDSDEPAPDPSV